jgi:hypothetical protein
MKENMKKANLVIFLLVLVSCSTPEAVIEDEEGIATPTPMPTTPMPAERPEDFRVIYNWDVGSLPPPHHYSYTITIGPGGEGEIEFVAGYESLSYDDPSIWIEEFRVSEEELDALYHSAYLAGVFEDEWVQMEKKPTGGSTDRMIVIAYGRQYEIPSHVVGEAKTKALELRIEDSVPQEIWDKLNEQYEKYVEEYEG